jgi:SAM (Sterile alpha motif) domain-containing protein
LCGSGKERAWEGKVQSVASWLKSLSLEQYSKVFADNDVDFETLRLLAESDFEKLGVSLGHRKKLLKAVSELETGLAQASIVLSNQASPTSLERKPVGAEGERRADIPERWPGNRALGSPWGPECDP